MLAAVCGCMIAPVQAQERTAGSSLETQGTWTALKAQIEELRGNVETVRVDVDALKLCATRGRVYAPSLPSPDDKGCVVPAAITNIQTCAASGQLFNGTGCVAPKASSCYLSTMTVRSDQSCPSAYGQTGFWQNMVSGNGDHSGAAMGTIYCGRVICTQ